MGAARLAEEKLDSEVPVEGWDEITDLARTFNTMSQSLKEAAERERAMEKARRALIAAVSHDRAPLAATRALIEAVADGVAADPETEARYLKSASRELAHLSRLAGEESSPSEYEEARMVGGAVA